MMLQMCGIALICVGLWMHICHDSLFYGVLLLDNSTSPVIFLRRLTTIVFAVGCVVTAMCFIGGCGAATECVCFIVCVRPVLTLRRDSKCSASLMNRPEPSQIKNNENKTKNLLCHRL